MDNFYKRIIVALVLEILFAYFISNTLYHWTTKGFIRKCLPVECSTNITEITYDGCNLAYNVSTITTAYTQTINIIEPNVGCYSYEIAERIIAIKSIYKRNQNCMIDPIDLIGFIGDRDTARLDLLDLNLRIISNLILATFASVGICICAAGLI